MAEFARYTLDDGSEVVFEPAKSDLVAPRAEQPVVRGRQVDRMPARVAEAAEEVAGSLGSWLARDEVSLAFGLKVSGGVAWFFAKAQGEGTIKVALMRAGNAAATGSAVQPETRPGLEKG